MFFTVLFETAIILILALLSYFGYKKGLFLMTAGLAKTLFCLIFSLSLYTEVGEELIAPMISVPVKSYLSEYLSENCSEICTAENLPSIIKLSAVLFDFDIFDKGNLSIEGIIEHLADPLIITLSKIISFILLLGLSRLIFRLVISLANRLLNVGILGQINKILGVALSGFFAVIVAWVFVTCADYILRLDSYGGNLSYSDIRTGPLYRLFLEISPLKMIFKFQF